MKQYRKRPLIIEAAQWNGETLDGQHARTVLGDEYYYGCCNEDGMLFDLMVKTLEGVMTCEVGDWLIKGIKGEFYPCKPDIFAETYEAVE
jgi:hypothetical protein